MKDSVKKLLGGLVVSCQAYEDTPSYGADNMAMFAKCALVGGAAGIRACWADNVAAIRKLGDFPIIGINKGIADENAVVDENTVFITPTFESAKAVIEAGADIIGLDCGIKPNRGFDEVCALLRQIREAYPEVAIMADLMKAEDGIALAKTGLVDILSTTLSVLDPAKKGMKFPDIEMIKTLKANTDLPVNAEGGIWQLDEYEACLAAGADMVTIGTAITRPHLITKRFVDCNNNYLKNK